MDLHPGPFHLWSRRVSCTISTYCHICIRFAHSALHWSTNSEKTSTFSTRSCASFEIMLSVIDYLYRNICNCHQFISVPTVHIQGKYYNRRRHAKKKEIYYRTWIINSPDKNLCLIYLICFCHADCCRRPKFAMAGIFSRLVNCQGAQTRYKGSIGHCNRGWHPEYRNCYFHIALCIGPGEIRPETSCDWLTYFTLIFVCSHKPI